uniref:Peptidase A1 domain-containing protein n=1 Tax=Leersia perrieri TaxID=77586 RepID=A0A0D9X8R6_9ORYZ
MASPVFVLVLVLVATTLLPVSHCSDSDGVGFHLNLRHVDAHGSYTKPQLVSRAICRSKARVAALQAVVAAAATAAPLVDPITAARILVAASQGEYLMDLAVGTPPLYYTAMLDTGSDLIWTQCAPCVLCADQPTPYFRPTRSDTFRLVPCRSHLCAALPYPSCFQRSVCVYQYNYGDYASTAGVLAGDTFTFGSGAAPNSTKVMAPNVAFGCGNINSGELYNSSGMVGLGRGPLSLVSQLGPSRFSYCLTSFLSPEPSRLYFGVFATLNSTNASTGGGSPAAQSTPLVVNAALPSLYFVSLNGISLGDTRLPIDPLVFTINDDGTGGVFIDSGTSLTWLQQDAYDAVRGELVSVMSPLPPANDTEIGLETCFPWPPPPNVMVTVPDMELHFDGANMTVPPENYMLIDGATGFLCLAMIRSGDATIIGNYQQQNMHPLVVRAGAVQHHIGDLDHPYAGLPLSTHDVVRHGARASKARAAWLNSKLAAGLSNKRGGVSSADVRLAPLSDQGHTLTVGVGTPPQPRRLIVDTGSDLIWTQCKLASSRRHAAEPALYDPGESSTFQFLPCSCRLCQEGQFSFKNCTTKNRCVYEDVYGSATAYGVLASESFTFGVHRAVTIPLGFGCGALSAGTLAGATGILGLSPESLSLITQLKIHRFSYCLTPFADRKTSPILFGKMADLSKHKTTGPIQTTSLLKNPVETVYYYVPLVGISLGNKRLAVPASSLAMRPDGSGGTIVDSGSTVAYLVETAYEAVKEAVIDVVRLPVAKNRTIEDYDVCFLLPRAAAAKAAVMEAVQGLPPLVLHFDGGAAMVLPPENYLQEPRARLMCLAVANSTDGSGVSVIGNVQQQNMHVLFDVRNQKFSFAPTQCDQI